METYLTIFELAEKTKLSISALRRAVQLHEIPFHRFMRWVRFKPSEIDAWIATGDCKAIGAGEETGAVQGAGAIYRAGTDGQYKRKWRGTSMKDIDKVIEEACCPPAADSLGVCSANSTGKKIPDIDKIIDEAKSCLLPFESWEQLPRETGRAYAAFCTYRDFGSERSIRKAAEKHEANPVKQGKR